MPYRLDLALRQAAEQGRSGDSGIMASFFRRPSRVVVPIIEWFRTLTIPQELQEQYGYPPLEYVDASKIKVPLMGHWATEDAAFPMAKVDELEQKLRAAQVNFEFHRYNAKHAFANETADLKNLPFLKHDPAAAELAWRRTMGFLAKHLK